MPKNLRKRNVQIVPTKSGQKTVVCWMLSEINEIGSEDKIAAKAVDYFPKIFCQFSRDVTRKKVHQCLKAEMNFYLEFSKTQTKI